GTLASVKHACEINAHDVFPLRFGGFQQTRCRRDRRVVDHDIEAAVTRHGGSDQSVNLSPLADVDALAEGLASGALDQLESGHTAFEGCVHDSRKSYSRAFFRECQGDRAADSGARPGNYGNIPR